MGLRLVAHFYDRTEALIAIGALDAAGVPVFAAGDLILGVQPFHEIAYAGVRIMAAEEDVDAAVAVLREARAKRSFEGERLSTHHFLIPSLLIWFFTGAPMPLRAHRWHDVWRNQRV